MHIWNLNAIKQRTLQKQKSYQATREDEDWKVRENKIVFGYQPFLIFLSSKLFEKHWNDVDMDFDSKVL